MPESSAHPHAGGFSFVELLIAIAVLLVVSAVVTGALINVANTQGTVSNRTAMHGSVRAVVELLQQEIGQSGRVGLPEGITLTGVAATGTNTVGISSSANVFDNELLTIDSGDKQETVPVTVVGTNQIRALFAYEHAAGAPVTALGGFASGIVPTTITNGSSATVLKMYGDIADSGNMQYVEYRCDPMAGYLYRTAVPFNAASKPAPSGDQVLLDNLQPNPGAAPCFSYQEQTTATGTTYVASVGVTFTVRTMLRDPKTQDYQTQTVSLLNVSPRNTFEVLRLASVDATSRIQPMPPSIVGLLP